MIAQHSPCLLGQLLHKVVQTAVEREVIIDQIAEEKIYVVSAAIEQFGPQSAGGVIEFLTVRYLNIAYGIQPKALFHGFSCQTKVVILLSGPAAVDKPGVHQPSVTKRKVGRKDGDRKSTRLNSSHANISYAVFCLKQ